MVRWRHRRRLSSLRRLLFIHLWPCWARMARLAPRILSFSLSQRDIAPRRQAFLELCTWAEISLARQETQRQQLFQWTEAVEWSSSMLEIEVAVNSEWYSTQTESDFKNQLQQFCSNTHSFKRCNHISKFAQPLSPVWKWVITCMWIRVPVNLWKS